MRCFCLVFFFVSSFSFSQDYKSEIEKDFTDYMQLTCKKDFKKSVEYLIPDYFELIPKKDVIQLLESSFNSSKMDFQLDKVEITYISDVEKVKNQFYVILKYSSQINLKFFGEEDETTEDETTRIEYIKDALKDDFGSENVNYNDESGYFEISTKNKLFVRSSNGKVGWKFLEYREGDEYEEVLKRILPQKVLEMN